MASSSWSGYGPAPSSQGSSEPMQRGSSGDRPRKSQSRQLLSCTKCRERKVKCDRTKPCSACCARGHPRECEFIVGEGSDYSLIQQSYEIRKLRQENERLKARLQAARLSHSADEDDDQDSGDFKSKASGRAAAAKQRRFRTGERIDNLYFGTPGLANIVNDFASLQLANLGKGAHSLTHTMPRNMPKAQEIYCIAESMYPFPVFAGWCGESANAALVGVLPKQEELFRILDLFQRRGQSSSFPHTPDEVTKREVQRFLDDAEGNAQKYPDMLALIFATLAMGLQLGQWDRDDGQWVEGAMAGTTRTADIYVAASMQALRMASYMSQPTLLGIQTLVMLGPYLTNSGRFLDAYTLFGTTIRMAHSIGLHRNPKLLDPAPPLRECMFRQTLWWWMLHMDQQYSVTLGRPLGISGIGDCPPPEPLTTNPTILRLGEFVDHFTVVARRILSSDGMMSATKIDEFTDTLIGLWDTMPEALQFNESWLRQETALPDWPLEVMSATLFAKVQSFLILLNRQRVERTRSAAMGGSSPEPMAPPPPRPPQPTTTSAPSSFAAHDQPFHPAVVRGRALVVNSSVSLLHAFLFFQHRQPAVLICWTMGQQAFNASMILILDAWESENEANVWLVTQAYLLFKELETKGVHKLAKLAADRIQEGLEQINARREERKRAAAAAASRRSSQATHQPQPPQQHPQTMLDTATMSNWTHDSVMGNTGMFLLEDQGLQSYVQQPFSPLAWNMAGGGQQSNPSQPPSPTIPNVVPVSKVTAAPFPVMSPPYASIPVTNSPYAVGLQPRMPHAQHQPHSRQQLGLPQQHQGSAYAPVDPQQQAMLNVQHQQGSQSFSQHRGPRKNAPYHHGGSSSSSNGAACGGPRGVHKMESSRKSVQRRK
ncbi:hypothetical protein KC354_g11466 [Hortaea werneckii]|nr:hypothetical protein KC354_g11466 [Hortaea werneckii]